MRCIFDTEKIRVVPKGQQSSLISPIEVKRLTILTVDFWKISSTALVDSSRPDILLRCDKPSIILDYLYPLLVTVNSRRTNTLTPLRHRINLSPNCPHYSHTISHLYPISHHNPLTFYLSINSSTLLHHHNTESTDQTIK